jgi:hypothetical protein
MGQVVPGISVTLCTVVEINLDAVSDQHTDRQLRLWNWPRKVLPHQNHVRVAAPEPHRLQERNPGLI